MTLIIGIKAKNGFAIAADKYSTSQNGVGTVTFTNKIITFDTLKGKLSIGCAGYAHIDGFLYSIDYSEFDNIHDLIPAIKNGLASQNILPPFGDFIKGDMNIPADALFEKYNELFAAITGLAEGIIYFDNDLYNISTLGISFFSPYETCGSGGESALVLLYEHSPDGTIDEEDTRELITKVYSVVNKAQPSISKEFDMVWYPKGIINDINTIKTKATKKGKCIIREK